MRYILSKIQPQNIQKLESVKIYNHSKAKHENKFKFKQQIACWFLKLPYTVTNFFLQHL